MFSVEGQMREVILVRLIIAGTGLNTVLRWVCAAEANGV